MSRELAPLPKSSAETAWELLEDVAKVIEEEPKRYDQTEWVRFLSTPDEDGDYDWDDQPERYPMCGTVGCVAGWALLLKKGRMYINRYTVEDEARELLGLDGRQTAELFSGAAICQQYRHEHGIYPDVDLPEEADAIRIGTPEYARLGAAHIRRFMARYEDQLKLWKV